MPRSPFDRSTALGTALHGLLAAAAALLVTGCQSIALAVANTGVGPADASVVHDPTRGLALDVYRPALAKGATAPVVVFLYGGGWKTGSRDRYRFVGQRLAERGILAVVADYRTYPLVTFPGFVEDGARALAWARRHAPEYSGDPDRVFIAGHSAGAQIAALIGTDPRYLAAHGMTASDLAGVIGLAGPYDFVISGGYRPVFGEPALWPQAQAINYVDGNEPPFLLIHGTEDRVVEARDSQQLADKLRANGVRAQLLWLPGAGHLAPMAAIYAPSRHPEVLESIVQFTATGEAPAPEIVFTYRTYKFN